MFDLISRTCSTYKSDDFDLCLTYKSNQQVPQTRQKCFDHVFVFKFFVKPSPRYTFLCSFFDNFRRYAALTETERLRQPHVTFRARECFHL